jgi:thymidylate kinase
VTDSVAESDAILAVAHTIDSLTDERVLVFGSVPPGGRDLDLLVPTGADRLAEDLVDHGFLQKGRHLVRFERCSAVDVELVPATDWGLHEGEVLSLFESAKRIERFSSLVRPSPEHALLILARRLVRGDGRLDTRRRARVDRALHEDPNAWERAGDRAAVWGAVRALACLRSAYVEGRRVPLRARVAALAEQRRSQGSGPIPALAAGWRAALTRPPGGAVIALSGLDGSGKSSQAHHLRRTLERLGYPAVVEWHRFANIPALNVIAGPIKGLLRISQFSRRDPQSERPPLTGDPGSALRERSRAVNYVWVTVFAVATGLSHRRSLMPHLRRGMIVICDRYVLDSVVHLQRRYGSRKRYSLQRRLIRFLAPRPMRAYLLDVPPSVAHARKPERFAVGQLERQAALYLEERAWAGARRLDGSAPMHEVCEAVARDVWLALRSGRRDTPLAVSSSVFPPS